MRPILLFVAALLGLLLGFASGCGGSALAPAPNSCSWRVFTPWVAGDDEPGNADECDVTPAGEIIDLTYRHNAHVFTLQLDTTGMKVGDWWPAAAAAIAFDGCSTWNKSVTDGGSPGGSIIRLPPQWDVAFQGVCDNTYAWFAEFRIGD